MMQLIQEDKEITQKNKQANTIRVANNRNLIMSSLTVMGFIKTGAGVVSINEWNITFYIRKEAGKIYYEKTAAIS